MMASTPTKKGQHKSKKERRNAMTTEEMEEMKRNLLNTPKKERGKLRPENKDVSKVEKSITLQAARTFPRQIFTTPLETQEFWERELPEIEKRLKQMRVYCIINNDKLDQQEMQTLCTAVFTFSL
jgi:hypothetical protein